MANFKKEWNTNDTYNFNIELNRIENYNLYVEKWLRDYYNYNFNNYIFNHKTNWNINDIVDLKDINRVKGNINKLLEILGIENEIKVSQQLNQKWTSEKANEIENRLKDILDYIGGLQFQNNICNLAICGNNQKLVGG